MFHAVKLSKNNPTPLYIQLADELAKLIQAHLLYDGMKLPTIRSLSKQLGINRDTVVSAYKLLENQGLIESHIGKGTYITASKKSDNLNTASPTKQTCCSQLTVSKHFFPDSLCSELTMQIVSSESWEAFTDPLYRSRHLLKQGIASYFESTGLTLHYSEVRLIDSIDEFLLALYKASPKTGICVEQTRDLSFSCYLHAIGAKIYEIPLTAEGMDLEVLEKQLRTGNISYIFLSSYLQNPTGISYSQDTKKQLAHLAELYDCYIIEDNTYAELYLPPGTYKPLYTYSPRVIYLHNFCKLYLPYFNYFFTILPHDLLKQIPEPTNYNFNERLMSYYLTSKSFQLIRQELIHYYQQLYQTFIVYFANAKLPLKIINNQGGLSFWIEVPLDSYDELCQFLIRHEIVIAPCELFSITPRKGFFRLSITQLQESDVLLIIKLLEQFFHTSNKLT